MPSGEHESPIASAPVDPDLVAWLFTLEQRVPYQGSRLPPRPLVVDVEPARAEVDGRFMTVTAEEYKSELLRELATKHDQLGMARGMARGMGRAVLKLLDKRGVAVSAAARELVLACTDLVQLDTWLHRAVTADSIDDVIRA